MNEEVLLAVEESLRQHYFGLSSSGFESRPTGRFPDGYLDTAEGELDLAQHLTDRVETIRRDIVPWISDVMPLRDLSLLEIGSGTGSSTLAFAEQGAEVTALDVDSESLQVARDRCRAHGISSVEFVVGNAAQITSLFQNRCFDFVIFYASLEHMTLEERINALAAAWNILAPTGYCGVIETPNRLWYYDSHTAFLPFYHWLPDDLAMRYSRFSPRASFREEFDKCNDEARVRLARIGRSVSFHEFELAIGDAAFDVVSCLSRYQRRHSFIRLAYWLLYERGFESRLKKAAPQVNGAFLHPQLDIIVRKVGQPGSVSAR